MKSIGWFSTARGPGSLNLFTTMLDALDSGKIDARIAFIFINREVAGNEFRAKFVRLAEEHGIPVILFPSDKFLPELKKKNIESWRAEYGRALRQKISSYDIDFAVLAGYMLIFDPETCKRYTLINLHPALPDTYKGTWEEIVGQVVDNQDEMYGATVHICTPELDRGETISYDCFEIEPVVNNISGRDGKVKAIRAVELKREAPLLIETIKLIVDGEVMVKDWKVHDRRGKKVTEHPCLAEKVSEDLGV